MRRLASAFVLLAAALPALLLSGALPALILLGAPPALILLGAHPALAVEPSEMLADPLLETRARDISKNLRCLVCQNQSIDDSNADLARDLRVLVRQRLVMGDSDSAVINYVVARYGDYVLLKPPFKAATYVLWFGPALILGAGIIAVVVFYRRRRAEAAPPPVPLTEEEKRRVDELLDDS